LQIVLLVEAIAVHGMAVFRDLPCGSPCSDCVLCHSENLGRFMNSEVVVANAHALPRSILLASTIGGNSDFTNVCDERQFDGIDLPDWFTTRTRISVNAAREHLDGSAAVVRMAVWARAEWTFTFVCATRPLSSLA